MKISAVFSLIAFTAHTVDSANTGHVKMLYPAKRDEQDRRQAKSSKMSKAMAAMNNRSFVTPDDIHRVAHPVLNHRIILSPEREMEGMNTSDVIRDIINSIEVPR